jgi:hypothetical protein
MNDLAKCTGNTVAAVCGCTTAVFIVLVALAIALGATHNYDVYKDVNCKLSQNKCLDTCPCYWVSGVNTTGQCHSWAGSHRPVSNSSVFTGPFGKCKGLEERDENKREAFQALFWAFIAMAGLLVIMILLCLVTSIIFGVSITLEYRP